MHPFPFVPVLKKIGSIHRLIEDVVFGTFPKLVHSLYGKVPKTVEITDFEAASPNQLLILTVPATFPV